jgi:hypothetical protein
MDTPQATSHETTASTTSRSTVDEHGDFCGSLLLGTSHRPLQRRRRFHPGCGERISCQFPPTNMSVETNGKTSHSPGFSRRTTFMQRNKHQPHKRKVNK